MFLGIFRGAMFLGNFRGPHSSEIPDANSEEYFVGTSEDWTIGNFLGIYRGSPPSVYFEELSDDLVVLGVSSEIQFLGIPSEISEGFPRKNEFPRSYFRGLLSSRNRERGEVLDTTAIVTKLERRCVVKMTTRSKMPGKEIALEAALFEEVNERLSERLFATDRRNVYVCTSSEEDKVEVLSKRKKTIS
ncbi:hypothetical protein F2Q69_00050132 [Brassica cretica]|uniref:Uncharacterized protein n=1 Tax=Brassica cretica TaxID=69181 RepID=A0A8S9Q4G3_BRACR|nr:hypothetical protein F2Q69_00050132 [Brassica cretica]